MEIKDIEKYVNECRRFEMPELQEQFSLSYEETNKVIDELQKSGVIKFRGGFSYEAIRWDKRKNFANTVCKPQNEQEEFFVQALWECVKNGESSVSLVQRRLVCGYNRAASAIEWMEKNNYINPYPDRKVKMSVEEYVDKFGYPEDQRQSTEEEERKKYIEERRRALMERLNVVSDDDDDDEDYSVASARRKYLERRRAMIEEMKRSCDTGNKDDGEGEDGASKGEGKDDGYLDLKPILVKCIERGLQDDLDKKKYILGLDGEMQLELKFVNDGNALKISDAGKTFADIGQSKCKIKNILKRYPRVVLSGNEISITINEPQGTLMALLTLYSAIDAVKRMK
ncbi:MAG: hypothetical protein NC099_03295 [Corallococcus sp.]|nr:hypothetical protein [Corallococcus sp.]